MSVPDFGVVLNFVALVCYSIGHDSREILRRPATAAGNVCSAFVNFCLFMTLIAVKITRKRLNFIVV